MLVRRLAILLPLLLFFASPAPAAEVEDPYVKLFKALEGMAANGDPQAEYGLGQMYENGIGAKVDPDQAHVLYLRSAAKGNALAQRRLYELELGACAVLVATPNTVGQYRCLSRNHSQAEAEKEKERAGGRRNARAP